MQSSQLKTKVLYSKEQVAKRIGELAEQIAKDYKDKNPLLIGILNGTVIFMSDLIRALYRSGLDAQIDFLSVSSYTKGDTFSGASKVIADIRTDISDRHALIVEDIIDTGYTLQSIREYLLSKKPKSLKIVTLLDKVKKREVNIPVDYIGFTMQSPAWVIGYGFDTDGFGRGREDVEEKIS
ncbi:MAG: hypoxanthine phosphoribosyltransferase [Candidatus Levybacteria bacterium]|nr:hypoxanthine phosphoribosyltransferase [Candidatus Levybacteria bacterium]